MKIQDILAILGVAAATVALTLGLALPSQVEAVNSEPDGAATITPLIAQPTLKLAGLDVQLAMDKPHYAPDDSPVVMLQATNTTDQQVDTNVWIGMMASSAAMRISRAPTMPSYLWSEQVPLTLAPGETKHLQVATETSLAAGNTFSVTMSSTDQKAMFARQLNLNVVATPETTSR